MISEISTELYYFFLKKITYKWHIHFWISNRKRKEKTIRIFDWILECDQYDEQTCEIFAFDWLPVSSDVSRLESDSYSDKNMKFDCPRKYFRELFSENVRGFINHTVDRVTKPFLDIISVGRN